jgi:hypothetical protein
VFESLQETRKKDAASRDSAGEDIGDRCLIEYINLSKFKMGQLKSDSWHLKLIRSGIR